MALTAVVTGASGYIATELVKQLLSKGYTVRGTVRSVANTTRTDHLKSLGAALPGSLTLHEADLLAPGSFDSVVSGADLVFHTASPFIPHVTDPQTQLVTPAVEGTKNVMSAVVKSKATVRRVVLTSSFAAVRSAAHPLPAVGGGELYTEADWNTSSQMEDEGYFISKAQAERAAWEIAEREGVSLCTINPTFVFGPVTSARTDATSINMLKDFLEGATTSLPGRIVDVRDIAAAHIAAAEIPGASGRHIASNATTVDPAEVAALLAERLPEFAIPSVPSVPKVTMIDNSKVERELSIHLRPWSETFVDMAVTLIALGIAKPARKE